MKTEKRRDQRGRDSENMRGEKKQREGRKLRAYRETVRQRRQNSCFLRLQRVKKKIIFIGDMMREREIVFQKKKNWKTSHRK